MSNLERHEQQSIPDSSAHWLTIEAACQFLGVDQSTLRRWSDSGKVPVFRTPGGHRRYNEDDLKALLKGEPRPRRRMSRQVLTDLSFSAYESDFLRQVRSRDWYRAYNTVQLEELRSLGRKLVDLAIRSISERADHRQIVEEGQAIGRRYGSMSADVGLSADDAVEAFLFFRYPVIQAMTRFIEEENIPAKRSGRIHMEVSQFLDQVLVATVSAHTAAQQ
ncbi:MAG TPA: helix-turn-helix domain-containing protein [Nitrolancea sp.]|jgi:excisionase family DNA binding protein|nr:helix-turn-helix domain-containing protein [Nitrolancea sp.]